MLNKRTRFKTGFVLEFSQIPMNKFLSGVFEH